MKKTQNTINKRQTTTKKTKTNKKSLLVQSRPLLNMAIMWRHFSKNKL